MFAPGVPQVRPIGVDHFVNKRAEHGAAFKKKKKVRLFSIRVLALARVAS